MVECPKCGLMNSDAAVVCWNCYAALKKEVPAGLRPRFSLKRFFLDIRVYEYFTFLVIICLFAIIAWYSPPFPFLTNTFNQILGLGVMAIGVTFVILSGGLDFSAPAICALAGVIAVRLVVGSNILLILLACLSVGAAAGLINGLVITRAKVHSGIATLGMSGIAGGLAAIYMVSQPLNITRAGYMLIGNGVMSLLILLGAILIAHIVLISTDFGMDLRASAALTDETQRRRLTVWVYIISGALAGIAGILMTARLNHPTAFLEPAWLLAPVTAVLLGGATLKGGIGKIRGAIVGTLIIAGFTSYFDLLRLPIKNFLVIGMILVFAAIVDRWKEVSWEELLHTIKGSHQKLIQIPLALVCFLILCILILYCGVSFVPEHAAIVMGKAGEVIVKKMDSTLWLPVKTKMILDEGDTVSTQEYSWALLKFSDGSAVRLAANTDLNIKTIERPEREGLTTRLFLIKGRVWSGLKRAVQPGFQYFIESLVSIVRVSGRAISVLAEGNKTYVSVYEGTSEVTSQDKTVRVIGGQETTISAQQPAPIPKHMAPEERALWEQQRPILEQMVAERWTKHIPIGEFLADDFNDNVINYGIWLVRYTEERVSVQEENGELRIYGVRSGLKAPQEAYGVLTKPFSSRFCEATVDFRVPQGVGKAILQLEGEGEGNVVSLVADPIRGYHMECPIRYPEIYRWMPIFGDEHHSFHKLSLNYNPESHRVNGYVDYVLIGSATMNPTGTVYPTLLYATDEMGHFFDCRFDNFETNISLPAAQPINTAVACLDINGSGQPEKFSTLLILHPQVRGFGVCNVRVTHPGRRGLTSALFTRKGTTVGLPHTSIGNITYGQYKGRPPEGDYFFKFTTMQGDAGTRWQRYEGELLLPPKNITEMRLGGNIYIKWDKVSGAQYYWTEMLHGDTREPLYISPLTTENKCAFPSPDITPGTKYFISVKAARSTTAIPTAPLATLQAQWLNYSEILNQAIEPGGNYFIALKTPQGLEYCSAEYTASRIW